MYLNAKALVQVQIIDGKIDPRRLTLRKTIWITIKSKIVGIRGKRSIRIRNLSIWKKYKENTNSSIRKMHISIVGR